jgi:nicotinate-nucleotide pyrophosphorylase (carboxylating)
MYEFPPFDVLRPLIELAHCEDLGAKGDDATSRLLIDPDATGVGTLYQKEVGIACGLPIVEMVCAVYDPRLVVQAIPGCHLEVIEGRYSEARQAPLLRVRGPMRSLLSAERVILNFLQRLGGIATQTQRFVKRIEGTSARIYDTRKTTPGLRLLEKYAVRCGGGFNHRIGLYDGLLVKDNHLATVAPADLGARLGRLVQNSRAEAPQRLIEVEVTTLAQFRQVLQVEGVDIVLLDNMDCPTMRQAVALRDSSPRCSRLELEASGGVSLQTVRDVAQTGVDRIAVGALTHSAAALDISLEIEPA